MSSHFHDARSPSQNVGNVLGERPCVRQTPLYRRHESGNAMKEALGMGHLSWDQPTPGQSSDKSVRSRHAWAPPEPVDAWAHARGRVACPEAAEDEPPLHRAPSAPPGASRQRRQRDFTPSPEPPFMSVAEPSASSADAVATPVRCAGQQRSGVRSSSRGARTASGKPTLPAGSERGDKTLSSPAGYRTAAPAGPDPKRPPSRAGSTPAPKLSQARFDNLRVAPAFGTGGAGSRFCQEYTRGAFPCRIDHGTRDHRIAWDVPLDELINRRDELMVLCADGLRETRHPYATVARLAFADLASLPGAEHLDDEALRKVLVSLRLALLVTDGSPPIAASPAARKGGSNARGSTPLASSGVFEAGLAAVRSLAKAEGSRLETNVHLVLPPIAKRMFSKAHKDAIQETLLDLEEQGGPGVTKIMRARGVAAVVVG